MSWNVSIGETWFIYLLQIMFIAFRLLNIIAWSWVWVLAPIWMSISLVIIVFLIVIFIIWISNR